MVSEVLKESTSAMRITTKAREAEYILEAKTQLDRRERVDHEAET